MTQLELQSDRLRLVLQSPEQTLALIESMSPADRAQVSPDWLARVRAMTEIDPWSLSFAIIERTSSATIGSCAFKGPPSADGAVEIAYGIDAEHRCKGYATEAAAALVNYALADSRVRVVCAHTFEVTNASARVLTKCGFTQLGKVLDPEDGWVWRWERNRRTKAEG